MEFLNEKMIRNKKSLEVFQCNLALLNKIYEFFIISIHLVKFTNNFDDQIVIEENRISLAD